MENLIKFLDSNGWNIIPQPRKDMLIYRIEKDGNEYEVQFFINKSYKDYYQKLKLALEFIAKFYDISYFEIVKRTGCKVRIDVEQILKANKTIKDFNELDLTNIVLFKNNQKVKIKEIKSLNFFPNSDIIENLFNK